jgi:uncharacterized protein YkwD
MPIPLLRRLFYTFLSVVSLSAFTPKASVPSLVPPSSHEDRPDVLATRSPAIEDEILRLVNAHRRSIRLAPLQMNAFESSVAARHSRDMATGRTPFGHEGFKDRMNLIRKKIGGIHVTAENVASGQMSAREVVDGWLHSPGHRRNIEGNFTLTGIGLARDRRGMIYFTQVFTR